MFFGLQYISDHPCCRMQDAIEVTPRELSEKLEIPRPTINQVLDKLLDLGKIERLGFGRGTRYRISQK